MKFKFNAVIKCKKYKLQMQKVEITNEILDKCYQDF